MKKVISFLSALALVLSLSVLAFAEDESTSGSTGGTQRVLAEVPGPTWELVIPADQTIEYLTEVTDIVHTNCEIQNPQHIPANNTINATLVHTGKFTMEGEGNESKTIAFTLNDYNQRDVAPGTALIASQYWSDIKANYCYENINVMIPRATWEAAEAGKYTTSVTYTSALANELTPTADGTNRADFA